jgi:hypothetical protein
VCIRKPLPGNKKNFKKKRNSACHLDKVPVGWTHKMKKDTNTMKKNTINLEVKSNLAKLLATENITIQHNNVATASFDVKNRVLTLPIFEEQKGDVYDMLIAHE